MAGRAAPLQGVAVVLLAYLLQQRAAGAFPRALRAEGRHFVSEDGAVVRLHAGEMHYFRVPEVYWEDRLRRLRAMGLNAVSTYVAWNWHETVEGDFDFSSERKDLVKFLRLARQEGLLVIFRPGPYICAEWDFGGLPAWLLGHAQRDGFNIRTSDPRYIKYVDRFWGELLPRVKPQLLENGGPVAVLQLENEYGHWGDANTPFDRAYFEHLRELARQHLGPNVLLITTDDDEAVARGKGGLPDVLAAVNFGPWEQDARRHIDKVFNNSRLHNGEAPELVMELWSGWFQMWQHDESAKKQFKTPARQLLAYVEALLERNASFTLYMAHGGTNFGLWPSAGFLVPEWSDSALRWHSGFVSTSYDYAAPISEDGRHGLDAEGGDKYEGLRGLLARHRSPSDAALPDEPPPPRREAYAGGEPGGAVAMRRRASLREFAVRQSSAGGPAAQVAASPMAMEQHGQQGGMVLYRYHPARPGALQEMSARWHASGLGRTRLFWPRAVVAVLASVAGTSFLWRKLRCCRCCSLCAAVLVALLFKYVESQYRPDEGPLVLQARDRVTVWQGQELLKGPYLNLEHVCCPWQVKDLAVHLTPTDSGPLDILVENLGRRAFMPRGFMGESMGLRHIWYDWKGLVSARIGSEPLVGRWETFALPLADLHALNGSAPAAAAAVGPDGRAEAASAVTASQSVPRLPDIERTQSKVGATRSQSKWWPWSAKRQQTLDTDHDDTIDGGRESTGTEDQYMQTEPSTPGTGRPADMCLEDWLRLFKEPKFKVDEEASSENSDGIFDEQYKQMRKHFRSVLIAEQQRAEAERLEAEDDEYLDEGALDKPDALVLKSIDQAIADYPESGLSSKSSKAPSRVTSAGSMWRSPNRSPRTPPKTPRTPTRSPSRAASRLAARGSTVGGGKGSNSGPNTPQSGRSRSRQHLRGGSMANLELQHAANTWAYLVPRAWSRDRLDQLHKDMEADLAYPAPAEPSEDIAHYQQLMRDRLEALGVENAQKENFSKTADPSKAVKACVKRYHEHCHELEIFHGFTREDAVPEGLDKPEKSALRGYIRALCDDPDMPDVIPKSKRKPAPKKETSMPPLRRLDSAGAIGMRLLRVMRFVRNLPHRARTKTPPSRSGTRPPSRAASRISRGSLLSRASKASAVSQKSAAV